MTPTKLAPKQWAINDGVVFDVPQRITNASSKEVYAPKPAPLREGADDHLKFKSKGNSNE
ncbi:MAG: hypothetical protein ACREUY_03335 [Burkholderiales bacterium]